MEMDERDADERSAAADRGALSKPTVSYRSMIADLIIPGGCLRGTGSAGDTATGLRIVVVASPFKQEQSQAGCDEVRPGQAGVAGPGFWRAAHVDLVPARALRRIGRASAGPWRRPWRVHRLGCATDG